MQKFKLVLVFFKVGEIRSDFFRIGIKAKIVCEFVRIKMKAKIRCILFWRKKM